MALEGTDRGTALMIANKDEHNQSNDRERQERGDEEFDKLNFHMATSHPGRELRAPEGRALRSSPIAAHREPD